MIKFGIESGDPSILGTIKKEINLNQSRKAIVLSRRVGLKVLTYYIIGFPNETIKSIKSTIQFAASSKSNFAIFNFADVIIPNVPSEPTIIL